MASDRPRLRCLRTSGLRAFVVEIEQRPDRQRPLDSRAHMDVLVGVVERRLVDLRVLNDAVGDLNPSLRGQQAVAVRCGRVPWRLRSGVRP